MSLITTEIIFTMLPTLVGVGIFAVAIEYLKVKVDRKLIEKYGESNDEKINRLAQSLKEATSLSSEIEREINRRHKIVKKLRTDVERFDELAKLKELEVEAVVQTVRGELQKEGNKSLLKSAALNLIFFIAGVLVTIYMV